MNIYIACGLTHVPRNEFSRYVEFIHGLAQYLTLECDANVRYALKDSDPQLAGKPFGERARLCYLWDREMVERADVVIADATYPSTGLGIELQLADNKDIPIVICFECSDLHRAESVEYETTDHARHSLQVGDGFVSLMALGLPAVFRIIPYSNPQPAYLALADAVSVFARKA